MKPRLVYTFGDFVLDVSNRQLTRENTSIPLTPKVFKTLHVLIEHAGQLVEKDELMQLVWQDRFVEESNLTFNIKMLRKALGDDAGRPRYIETVPRHGYRFIAETVRLSQNGSVAFSDDEIRDGVSGTEGTRRVGATPGQRTYVLIGSIVVFIVVIAAVSWLLRATDLQTSDDRLPLFSNSSRWETLSNSGSVFYPRVSPDGKYVAYITRDAGNQNLWLRELDSGTNVPLLQFLTDDIVGLMFSRNSDFIYYVRKPGGAEQDQAAIYRLSIFGGIPTKLVSNVQGWFSLSPIDDRIAFVRYDRDRRSVLAVRDADGGSERILATRDRPHNFRANRWSPGGKRLAVAVGHTNNLASDFGVVEIDVASGAERDITPQKFDYISDLEWVDSDRILMTARGSQSPHNQLWQLSLADEQARKIVDDGRSYATISLDRGGSAIAVSESVPDFKLHIEQLTGDPRMNVIAASPSIISFTASQKVVYTASKGQSDVWLMNADGSGQKQLTSDPANDFHALPSPDEKHIFFVSTRSGDAQIWRIGIDGSDPVRVTSNVGGFPVFVTPDGTTLYYLSSLDRKLWSVGTGGGEEKIYLDQRVLFPAFSPDGKYLAYFLRDAVDNNYLRLAVATANDPGNPRIFEPGDDVSGPIEIAWSPDARSLYYGSEGQAGPAVWRQTLAGKAPEKVKTLTDSELIDIAISPNGERIAWISGEYRREARIIRAK